MGARCGADTLGAGARWGRRWGARWGWGGVGFGVWEPNGTLVGARWEQQEAQMAVGARWQWGPDGELGWGQMRVLGYIL